MKILKFYITIFKKMNNRKEAAKFFFRSTVFFSYQNKLINFILSHDNLSKKETEYKLFLSKIHKPYLCNYFNTSRKVKVFIDNYTFLDKNFPKKLKKILYNKENFKVAEFRSDKGENYSVEFLLNTEYGKEGEFSLKIENSENITLSTLTFSFIQEETYHLFIGGIQGLKKDKDHKLIKAATKDFHGLFPKKILIEILYEILNILNIDVIKTAVGNKHHPFNSLRYKTNIKIYADYDGFWNNIGGKVLSSGLWELPDKIKQKKLMDIPSKKRSMYKKRYALLDEIKENMQENFELLEKEKL